MARITRFSLAKSDIVSHIKSLPKRVFKTEDLAAIFEENRTLWKLAKSMTLDSFIEELVNKVKVKEIKLAFPSNTVRLFTYGEVSIYQIALSINSAAYLSHYSAILFHQLTEQLPKTIYVTVEQSAKRRNNEPLLQENIDSAFSRPQRASENRAVYDGYTIYLLNGMYAGNEGVISIEDPDAGKISITNLERTLIDSAVRPSYSGGPGEVLKAFEHAKERVSINKLNAMLSKINFIYPYHQTIGFYLERAGYRESLVALLKKRELRYNFYLTYNMEVTEYSPAWKLYYPKGF